MRDGDYRNGPHHYVNVWEQLGYDGPPAVGGLGQNAVHPDDRARAEEAIRRYLAAETPQFETEVRLRGKDGSYPIMLARGASGTAPRAMCRVAGASSPCSTATVSRMSC